MAASCMGMPLNRHQHDVGLQWFWQHCPEVLPMQRWHCTLLWCVNIHASDGLWHVFQYCSECYFNDCMVECERFGCGNIIVRGGICSGSNTHLSHHQSDNDILTLFCSQLPCCLSATTTSFSTGQCSMLCCMMCSRLYSPKWCWHVTLAPVQPLSFTNRARVEHWRIWTCPNPTQLYPLCIKSSGKMANQPGAKINRVTNSVHKKIQAATNANREVHSLLK